MHADRDFDILQFLRSGSVPCCGFILQGRKHFAIGLCVLLLRSQQCERFLISFCLERGKLIGCEMVFVSRQESSLRFSCEGYWSPQVWPCAQHPLFYWRTLMQYVKNLCLNNWNRGIVIGWQKYLIRSDLIYFCFYFLSFIISQNFFSGTKLISS